MLGIQPCFGKGSCSAQRHSGWLSPSSSRDVAFFLECAWFETRSLRTGSFCCHKTQALSTESTLGPLPQGGDVANGNSSIFCLRSAHHYWKVAQKIQNRWFEGYSGLGFKKEFLRCVYMLWAQAKELRTNSREAVKWPFLLVSLSPLLRAPILTSLLPHSA